MFLCQFVEACSSAIEVPTGTSLLVQDDRQTRCLSEVASAACCASLLIID